MALSRIANSGLNQAQEYHFTANASFLGANTFVSGTKATVSSASLNVTSANTLFSSNVNFANTPGTVKPIINFASANVQGLPAGGANPAPPVGPALGAAGINIMGFCKEFNAKTKDQAGMILPVVISVYQDRSFSFILKSPPAAVLLKKAAGLAKGSGVPNRDKVGKVTKKQILEIVETKKEDLNASDPEMASRIIEGTARSMGIEVID